MNFFRGAAWGLLFGISLWLLIAGVVLSATRDLALLVIGASGFAVSVRLFLHYRAAVKAERFMRSVRNLEGWR